MDSTHDSQKEHHNLHHRTDNDVGDIVDVKLNYHQKMMTNNVLCTALDHGNESDDESDDDDSVAPSSSKPPPSTFVSTRNHHHHHDQAQKLQQVRHRNALYSKRKYYKKKEYLASLMNAKLQLLKKNEILRASNNELEAIIQHSHDVIVLKKVVQSEQTQRELLHLLQSPTFVPQLLDSSNFHTTQRPPMAYKDLASQRLYANSSHLFSSIATATANLAEHESSWNASVDTSSVNQSTATAQPFLAAVATSPSAVLHPRLGDMNRSLGAASLSYSLPLSSMESPWYTSPLLQQRLTKPNNTIAPLFQHDVLGRNCFSSGSGISHRDLSFHSADTVNEASLLPQFLPAAVEQRSLQSLLDHTTATTSILSSNVLELFLLQQLQEIKQRRRVETGYAVTTHQTNRTVPQNLFHCHSVPR